MTELVGRGLELAVEPALRVDGVRLLAHIDALSAIGATGDGGVTRPSFTAEDRQARTLVLRFMAEAGLCTEVDTAGNLIGRLPGENPAAPTLLIGSHVDSVPAGGALDGAYGVLAAIEVARTLAEHGEPLPLPVAVVAFTNEEGGPGTPTMFGSHALAGLVGPDDTAAYTADTGGSRPFGDALAAVGGDLTRIGAAAWPTSAIAAYLELHIEQGPVLDHERIPIGVVTAITGRTSVDIHVHGTTNHAGTTPMSLRHDALAVAASLVLAIQAMAIDEQIVRVATVGRCVVEPNAWNVIPGEVLLRADFRDISTDAMLRAVRRIKRVAAELAAASGTTVTADISQVVAPTNCAPELRNLVASACDELGLDRLVMPSGAGHDAQVIGRIAPVGMIFVPSIAGISHAPEEATAPQDLVHGADVLLRTVLGYQRTHR
jgi:N-carbamoyl-L-amino-acid hydrolase